MATKTDKVYTIECAKSGRFTSKTSYYYQTGTLAELLKAYSYTLEVGRSWQHEKGNAKIAELDKIKSVEKLVDLLGKASDNAARDGYSGKSFRVMADGEEKKSIQQ